jgi:hypothetical protein
VELAKGDLMSLRWNRRTFLKIGFSGAGAALLVETVPLARWVPVAPVHQPSTQQPFLLYHIIACGGLLGEEVQMLRIARKATGTPLLQAALHRTSSFVWWAPQGCEIVCGGAAGALLNNSDGDLEVELRVRQGDRTWIVGPAGILEL